MLKRGDKKGQALSTNAIVLIILGIVILVVLILGFTLGWDKIAPFLSKNNVDSIVNQCETACVTNSQYGYCSEIRKLNDGKTEVETNCATFAVISEYETYGIEECSTINCDFECASIMETGVMKETCEDTEDDVTSIAQVDAGMKCCVPKSA